MGTLMQDMRYGIRMLAKNPGFAFIAVLTLALGIGANTAIFSVVNAELLRPLPFRDSGRLVSVATANSRMHSSNGSTSYPDFMDWRSQNPVFEKMAAYTGATFTLTGQVNPAHLEGASVSSDTFDLLGVSPELGRTFQPGEDEPNHHVVVISDRLWKQQFGGDPGIVGRTITLDNSGYTVVGVMPANFRYPLQREPAAIWSTLSPLNETTDNSPPMVQHRGAHFLTCIARLKPGVTLAQAQAAMDVIASSLSKQYPETNKYMSVHLSSEQERLTGPIRPALLVMMIAVGLVLLIACVNVANLLLARATTRGREIAIRTAMGAGRIRVLRQLLTESLLLAIVAGIFGAALAVWGSDVLVRWSPENLPRVGEIHIDGWALAFTAGLSLLTGILFGLAPALQSTHSNIVEALKEGSLSMTAGRSRHGLRSSLVIVEMALALILLVSAGLLIRSLIRLQDVNPGFDPHKVMTASLDLPDAKYSDPKKAEFFRELIPQLEAIPGVQSAAAVFPLPMSGDEIRTSFQIEGRPVAKSDESHTSIRAVTPNYFGTMRIPLLQGREFTERDDSKATKVLIVNQAFAQQFFPGENPIGKHILAGVANAGEPPMREIIGVVGNVKFEDLTTEFSPESYIPYGQLQFGSVTIVVRSSKDPEGLAKPIASVVQSLDKDLPTYSPKTVEQYLDGTIAVPRFNTFLLAIFAALAMILTAVGLYGVISYTVAQRTHEIGIRMALGAQPGDMMRLVVSQGMTLALFGVAVGLVAALGLTRFLSSLLFGVSSTDPVSFAAVVAMLFAVVLLACYIPARRAMRVDPMVALRYE
ncbi:MAG TPA: ABC transporter permease [Candidatus Binatus sp.]|nr:ABC transporter permease [Candidatus Binatus sp.]